MFSTVAAVIGLGLVPAHADGVRSRVDLNWLAPEQCPKKADFLAALTRMLGDRVTIDHTLFANVVITQSNGASFQLKLTTKLDGASGQRVLEGRACKVVADAAAVTLALLLNPHFEVPKAAAPSESSNAQRAPAPSAPNSETIDRERPSAPSEPHASHFHGLLSSRFGLELGALPRVSPQFSLGLGAGGERASIWATGSYSPPQDVTFAAQNVGG